MPAVSNSSPIILYAAIGRLDLLREVYGEILIPPAVWRETVMQGTGRIGAAEAARAPWIHRSAPPSHALASLTLTALHPGEAEAIALAASLSPRIPVILDDLRARRIAEEAGLAVTGTAGVLVLAKNLNRVSSIGPLLDELRSAGLYLSEAAGNRLLKLAGER